MSVPVRVTPARQSAPGPAPVAEVRSWSGAEGDSPALALQRRLAHEWSQARWLPEPSALAPRLEALIAKASRLVGPSLFGATLAGIASLLT